LEEWEEKYWLDMLSYLNFDIKLFSWLNDKWSINNDVLYSNILWQIYDLFNQSMRVNDIFQRSLLNDINSWYTVLSELDYDNLRELFIKVFKENIWEEQFSFLNNEVIKLISVYKDKYLLRHMWDVSIYVWKNRWELNYLEDSFSEDDLEYTFDDTQKLFDDILK